MNPSQTQFNVLIILIAVVVLVGGIALYQSSNIFSGLPATQTPVVTTPTPVSTSTGTVATTTATSTSTVPTGGQLVSKPNWGVNFTAAANWKVQPLLGLNAPLTLVKETGEDAGDIISVSFVQSSTVTNTDAKFGTIVYMYDYAKNAWTYKQDTDTRVVPDFIIATPLRNTANNLPVFAGTQRWATRIVPLSDKQVLVFNVTGSGYVPALEAFVDSMRLIK